MNSIEQANTNDINDANTQLEIARRWSEYKLPETIEGRQRRLRKEKKEREERELKKKKEREEREKNASKQYYETESFMKYEKACESMPKTEERKTSKRYVYCCKLNRKPSRIHYEKIGIDDQPELRTMNTVADEKYYRKLFMKLFNYHEGKPTSDVEMGCKVTRSYDGFKRHLETAERISKELDEWSQNVKSFVELIKERDRAAQANVENK